MSLSWIIFVKLAVCGEIVSVMTSLVPIESHSRLNCARQSLASRLDLARVIWCPTERACYTYNGNIPPERFDPSSGCYHFHRAVCMNPGNVVEFLVTGIPSGTADDDLSSIYCPEGSVVVDCRCSIPDQTCDGVYVTGRTCRAQRALSAASHGIQAIATCREADPASYTVIFSYNTFNPTPTCPAGTGVSACWFKYDYMHNQFVRGTVDEANNACKPSSACQEYCQMQALCKWL